MCLRRNESGRWNSAAGIEEQTREMKDHKNHVQEHGRWQKTRYMADKH